MYVSFCHLEATLTNHSLAVFASVRKSPKSIPLLVYLHPPLAGQPTGVLANEVIDLLVAYYPEDLREGMSFKILSLIPNV